MHTHGSIFDENFAVWLALRHPHITYLCDFSRQARECGGCSNITDTQEMAPEDDRELFLYLHGAGRVRRHSLIDRIDAPANQVTTRHITRHSHRTNNIPTACRLHVLMVTDRPRCGRRGSTSMPLLGSRASCGGF